MKNALHISPAAAPTTVQNGWLQRGVRKQGNAMTLNPTATLAERFAP